MSERKQKLVEELARSRERLVAAVKELTDEELARPSPNEGWTVKDTLGHVAAAEGGMLVLIERSLQGQPTVVEGFDINRYNAGQVRRAKEKSVADLLAQMEESRAKLLALLDPLSDADLDRPAKHPVRGDCTCEEIFRIIAWHEGLHAEDIERGAKGLPPNPATAH